MNVLEHIQQTQDAIYAVQRLCDIHPDILSLPNGMALSGPRIYCYSVPREQAIAFCKSHIEANWQRIIRGNNEELAGTINGVRIEIITDAPESFPCALFPPEPKTEVVAA